MQERQVWYSSDDEEEEQWMLESSWDVSRFSLSEAQKKALDELLAVVPSNDDENDDEKDDASPDVSDLLAKIQMYENQRSNEDSVYANLMLLAACRALTYCLLTMPNDQFVLVKQPIKDFFENHFTHNQTLTHRATALMFAHCFIRDYRQSDNEQNLVSAQNFLIRCMKRFTSDPTQTSSSDGLFGHALWGLYSCIHLDTAVFAHRNRLPRRKARAVGHALSTLGKSTTQSPLTSAVLWQAYDVHTAWFRALPDAFYDALLNSALAKDPRAITVLETMKTPNGRRVKRHALVKAVERVSNFDDVCALVTLLEKRFTETEHEALVRSLKRRVETDQETLNSAQKSAFYLIFAKALSLGLFADVIKDRRAIDATLDAYENVSFDSPGFSEAVEEHWSSMIAKATSQGVDVDLDASVEFIMLGCQSEETALFDGVSPILDDPEKSKQLLEKLFEKLDECSKTVLDQSPNDKEAFFKLYHGYAFFIKHVDELLSAVSQESEEEEEEEESQAISAFNESVQRHQRFAQGLQTQLNFLAEQQTVAAFEQALLDDIESRFGFLPLGKKRKFHFMRYLSTCPTWVRIVVAVAFMMPLLIGFIVLDNLLIFGAIKLAQLAWHLATLHLPAVTMAITSFFVAHPAVFTALSIVAMIVYILFIIANSLFCAYVGSKIGSFVADYFVIDHPLTWNHQSTPVSSWVPNDNVKQAKDAFDRVVTDEVTPHTSKTEQEHSEDVTVFNTLFARAASNPHAFFAVSEKDVITQSSTDDYELDGNPFTL